MGSKIEALFGGVLALFIIVAAVVALASFDGAKSGAKKAKKGNDPLVAVEEIKAQDASVVCQCYDGGFALAGSDVDVMSSQYRTGYEQCRALGAAEAANAWTDGWNAKLSAKPYEASCRAYRRNKKRGKNI